MKLDDLKLGDKDNEIVESIIRKKGFTFKKELGINHFFLDGYSRSNIIIYNIGDEYYYIGSPIGNDNLISLTKWYKCDTIEGVKQCVEYLLDKLSNEYKSKYKVNEAKFNKRGKTTQDHKRDIEDILLEYVDDDLFSVMIRPIIPHTTSSKRIKDLNESTRSFEVVLGCNQEQIVKHKLFKMESVYNYEQDRYVQSPVGVTRLINAHLEKYYDLVKARLEKYNYFVFDSKHRPTHFSVIYRRNKYKSS